MSSGLREAWAWLVSVMALAGSWLADLEHWLALLGILVALMTAVERYYAIKLKRAQLRAAEDQ